ncbi:MAG: ribosomal L7Ae/L30e/S12e/Gadd45 family protein [Candidatus Aenigmarchaeota archaeon]|nr:ribosomal L7Ae/L30e/S12e/Gadd45 family protein [Candidatus Aenigmarchaeota archaeon]
MREIRKELKTALERDKVVIGTEESIKAAGSGKVKTLVYSANCPSLIRERLKSVALTKKLEVEQFDGNSVELGTMCGKPFAVAVLSF